MLIFRVGGVLKLVEQGKRNLFVKFLFLLLYFPSFSFFSFIFGRSL